MCIDSKWLEPFTDLLSCLFDHMHSSNPDLPAAHIIREFALCRDMTIPTSVESSQSIEYLCQYSFLKTIANQEIYSCAGA